MSENESLATEQVTYIRVRNLVPGNNPRKHFDAVEMAELEESVMGKGVIQPILVRPIEGGMYQIVAGERRWRAAKTTRGEEYQIPALCKQLNDDEVEELSLIENVNRANMSPAEEAIAASKILGRCGGDRDEATKRLCWTRQKLDKRLALMNCSGKVLDALTFQKIQLGHAELLAAAPKDKQDKVLERLLAAPSLVPVGQLKAQLEQIALSLATACFDKTECAGCQHNSSMQAAMFSETIGKDGHCTNAECFNAKTLAKLEVTKKEMEEEFPSVRIVNPGENFTIIKLVAEGATGVGVEQAKACRACANFGAAISNVPGKIGNVYRDQCFDAECNAKKVAERIKAEKVAEQASKAATTTGSSEKAASSKGAGEKTEKSASAKTAPATQVQDSTRLVEYRIKTWRFVLKKELLADPRENLSMLIGIMMTRGGSNVSSTKLSSAFEKLSGKRPPTSHVGEAAALVSNASDDTRQQMLNGIVLSITDSIEKNHLPEMLQFLQVDLKKHWKLNEEFLDLLTKSEIEVVAEEFGLKAAMGDKYSKAAGGKKADLIKALLNVDGFDYTGKVAKVLQYA